MRIECYSFIHAHHKCTSHKRSSRSTTRTIVAKPHQPRSRVRLSGGYPGRFLHTQQAKQSISSTLGALTSPGLSILSLRAAGVDCVNPSSRSRRKERGQARRHERESHPTIASLVRAARTGRTLCFTAALSVASYCGATPQSSRPTLEVSYAGCRTRTCCSRKNREPSSKPAQTLRSYNNG